MQPARQSAFNKAKVEGRQLHRDCFFFPLELKCVFVLYDAGRANANAKIAANEQLEKSLVESNFHAAFAGVRRSI